MLMRGFEDRRKVCVAMMFMKWYGHREDAKAGHQVRGKQAINNLNITRTESFCGPLEADQC